jgi:hypothetical protein
VGFAPWIASALLECGSTGSDGNSLGNFISKMPLYLLLRKMGKILVEMDVHSGLSELLEIDWRGRRIITKVGLFGDPLSMQHLSLDIYEEPVQEEGKKRYLKIRLSIGMWGTQRMM